jgi:hypothetical protein
VKIYLSVTALESQGRGTSSHDPLLIRAMYSSSIAMCQFESMRATQTEVGRAEGGVEEAMVMRVSQSRGSRKLSTAPCDHRVRVHQWCHKHDRVRVARRSRGCWSREGRCHRLSRLTDVGDWQQCHSITKST